MALLSMTGFGRGQLTSERAIIQVEVKALNGRFLDIRVKLPRGLTSLEPKIREILSSKIKRGSVEVLVSLKPSAQQEQQILDSEVLNTYVRLAKSAAERFDLPVGLSGASLLEMIQGSDSMDPQSPDFIELSSSLMECLDQALDGVCAMRMAEGANTQRTLQDIFASFEEHLIFIRTNSELFQEQLWKRWEEKLRRLAKDFLQEAEAARVRQELAILVQKADIAEEVARLESHLLQGREIFSGKKGAVGKHLDFLIQEMAREVNTLGVKSELPELAQRSLKMKVLVERLREQAQNIE
jgi:uncharacterized protein (TIGR00255 family)